MTTGEGERNHSRRLPDLAIIAMLEYNSYFSWSHFQKHNLMFMKTREGIKATKPEEQSIMQAITTT